MNANNKIKIGIISSSGGHLIQTYFLKKWWEKFERFWVTRKDGFSFNLLSKESKYEGFFPETRNINNFMKNFFLAWKILLHEKPKIIFSTGAAIAVPFFIVAKLLRIKTIFIETFIYIPKQTLSGKICYHLSDYFFVQNKGLKKKYKKSIYLGPII